MKMYARTKIKLIWLFLSMAVFYFTVIEYGHTRDVWWSLGHGCRMVALVWLGQWIHQLKGIRS